MIIYKGVQKRPGGALYDTAMIICKGGAKTVRGGWVRKRQGGCFIQWNLTNKTTSRSSSNGLICEVAQGCGKTVRGVHYMTE